MNEDRVPWHSEAINDDNSAVEPVEGMAFSDGDIECPCGEIVHLWYNGGELDRRTCRCGVSYWTEATMIVLRVDKNGKR